MPRRGGRSAGEPGAHVRPSLEAVDALQKRREGLLDHVLGPVRIESGAARCAEELWLVGLDDVFDRLRVAGTDPGTQAIIRIGSHVNHPPVN